ncbi:MAG: OmpA family protein [Yoonia sp.]|uniref:OmpA family protein n=1 Tax=Yoonia sp. TaxID=2212373 RepID=UPI003EF449D7
MRVPLTIGVLALTGGVFYAATQTIPATISPAAPAQDMAALDAANAQIEANRAEFDAQTTALNQRIADLDSANLEATAAVEAAIAESAQAQSQLVETSQQLDSALAENAALAQEVEGLTQQIATLTTELENTDTSDADATIAALNAQIADGQEMAAALQTRLTDLESENAALVQQIADQETTADAGDDATAAALAEAQTLLDQNAKELATAQERIAMLTEITTSQVQAATDLNAQIAGLEEQVATFSAQADTTSAEVTRRDEIIAGLMARAGAAAASPTATCQDQTDAILAGAPIAFEGNTITLDTGSIAIVGQLAAIVSECSADGLTLEIEGHTSEAGGEASNLLLSDGRAKAVRDALVTAGAPASSLRAVGFGASEPLADAANGGQSQRIVFDWEAN